MQEMVRALDTMESSWHTYRPREFILHNLSLEKQARDFVDLYQKHFGLSYDDGLKEQLLNDTQWKNGQWRFKIYRYLKDGAQEINYHWKSWKK
jgi:hypothetical protein